MRVGQQPIQWSGFCLAGLLCVGLAVVKLTTDGHWSWWRVLLPLWVIMGHNALYILVGLIWLSFVDRGEDEETSRSARTLPTVTNTRECYVFSCSWIIRSDEWRCPISARGFG
jgi:hypothetical protein